MSFNFSDIILLQIDVTSYCNSYCGGCSRNMFGGENNPNLTLTHLDFSTWKQLITEENLKYIQEIVFNGNHGDFSTHPYILDFLDYLYQIKPSVSISMHTNGGGRNGTFWKDLGELLKKFNGHQITFSIDGVEKNAARYRRGTNFDRIIKNAKLIIDTGANVSWRYVVFDHNIDDIPEAHQMAIDLSFSSFKLNRSYRKKIVMKKYKSFNDDIITAPEVDAVKDLTKKYNFKSKNQYSINDLIIKSNKTGYCPWDIEKKLQIDYTGKIWPCCYIADSTSITGISPRHKNLYEKITSYDKDFNNISRYSIPDILQHEFFKKDLPDAWLSGTFEVCNQCTGKKAIR